MAKKSKHIDVANQAHEVTNSATDNDDLNDQQTGTEAVEGDADIETDAATSQQQAKEDTINQLQQSVDQLQAELKLQQELVLRVKAEADNQLKREQRELEKHRQRSLEKIMRDLIEVRDTLERGLLAVPEDNISEHLIALRDGTAMTLKLLDKSLTDHGLQIIDPLHQAFDPETQEAVGMQPSEEHKSNTVIQVMQKGYRLHDRLLRPAMVMVAQ